MKDDIREEYKSITLRMSRLAVKGGQASQAYEDYLIDNLDAIIDNMADKDFEHLLLRKTMLVRDIESEEDYQYHFWHRNLQQLALDLGGLMDHEREQMERNVETLTRLLDDFKAEEWG
ncbi:hypothetical protein [Paenibacillus sp. P22]|uniref:hypothetical protein n=1 Tax=Paenibacillus sp. P22 TaxID=483908 RepID=UPI00043108D5|nr:hypothetical protein [Paenibacillus sp. P22]CDN41677.1 hypothetical protein BN871_AJ_00290 [Paenibacillus sp. P22]